MGARDSIRARVRRAIPRGGVLGAVLVCAVLCAPAAPARAGGRTIYAFVDEHGVTHYTNVPRGDKRFQPVANIHVNRSYRAPRSRAYDVLIAETAESQGLPPALIKAVIAAESAFDSRAVSRKGAQGLMQLMPETAASLQVNDPFEPTQNVLGGTTYLRAMIDRYGDLSRALAAYNAGPTAVDRHGGIPPYRETRAYVERVLTYYRRYHGDFAR